MNMCVCVWGGGGGGGGGGEEVRNIALQIGDFQQQIMHS